MTAANKITFERFRVIEHSARRAPASPGATSNFLVLLTGRTPSGRQLDGLGEAQPRGRATGDDPETSWQFLHDALQKLDGFSVPLTDRYEALREVRKLLADIDLLAGASIASKGRLPFRGTVLGIEIALLDLVARGFETSLGELLGRCRTEIDVHPPRTARPQPKGMARIALSGDVSKDWQELRTLAQSHTGSRSGSVGWWLELSGRLAHADAERFVDELVEAMRRGTFPPRIILEQPVGRSRRAEMAALQRRADRSTQRRFRRGLDLRVMADESLASSDDLAVLTADGGCRAINVKPARAGGLLATIDLVRRALDHDADMTVSLSDVAATSDVSAWAMHHLGLALPRLDHFVRSRKLGEHVDITSRAPGYMSGTRTLQAPSGYGLGVQLDLARVLPRNGRYLQGPGRTGPTLYGRHANAYVEERPSRYLTSLALRSHVVEREALAYGLETTRFSPTVFHARQSSGPLLIFGRSTRSPVSDASSFMIADQHKGATQALLARAGALVPEARIFANDDHESALAYARAVGYPVVTKPVAGTGGSGVSTNIASDEQLIAGFQAVRRSRFADCDVLVQRHVPGQIYRIVVLGDQVTAAATREPASVTGDGLRSIAELVAEKNAFRRENPRLRTGLIDRNRVAKYLATVGLALDSIPAPGERVFLSSKWHFAYGGDSIEVLHELHPSIADAAVRAVAAVPGLRFCGVDMLLEDHRIPVDQQAAGVCELNACPELVAVQYPLFGEPRPIARQLFLKAAELHSVPIAAEPATELSVHLTVTGPAVRGDYVTWMLGRARELGLSGWVSAGKGEVEAVAAGSVEAVSALASTAISGPPCARPESVTTRHTSMPQVVGFAVRRGAHG